MEGFEPSTTGTTIRRSTKLSYTHREDSPILSSACHPPQISLVAQQNYSPAFFHNPSTRFFTSADIAITSGHGRVNPSPGHFFVASIPIFDP